MLMALYYSSVLLTLILIAYSRGNLDIILYKWMFISLSDSISFFAGATMTTPSTGSGPEEIKPNPGSGKNKQVNKPLYTERAQVNSSSPSQRCIYG